MSNLIEILKNKKEILIKERDKKCDQAISKNLSYFEFEKLSQPLSNEINNIDRKIRLLINPDMKREIPSYGDKMSIEEFKEHVSNGNFIDYDGVGEYCNETHLSGIKIYPSDIKFNMYRKDFKFICWFNR